MMRVRLKTLQAGPRGVFSPGQILEVDDAEARALVVGDYAEFVEQATAPPPSETAVVAAPEAAVSEPPEVATTSRRRSSPDAAKGSA